MENTTLVELNINDLWRIQDLLYRVSGASDFEYQDKNYQQQIKDLELNIYSAIKELSNENQ
jgi:hypothetical protein